MSVKSRVLILKRLRAGDQDLLAKAYGPGGIIDLLVRDGLLCGSYFFGVFEPFNVVTVDLSQKGDIVVPNDVVSVERLSYLSANFRRFLWMSWIAGFILRNVRFFDDKLFELFLSYMVKAVRGREEVYRIKLRLDYLDLSGLKPRFLGERIPRRGSVKLRLSDGSLSPAGELETDARILRVLSRIYEIRRTGNVAVNPELARRAERILDSFIAYHTR